MPIIWKTPSVVLSRAFLRIQIYCMIGFIDASLLLACFRETMRYGEHGLSFVHVVRTVKLGGNYVEALYCLVSINPYTV